VTPADRKAWIEGSSAHFRFFSSVSPAATRAVSQDFETLREVVRQMTSGPERGGPATQDPVPSYVYLFNQESTFNPYRDQKWVGGWCSPRPDGNYIALRMDIEHVERTVFHEYLHQFLHQHFPNIPTWLDEGMAELYSTMTTDGNKVRLGSPDKNRFITIQTLQLMSVRQLLSENAPIHGSSDSMQVDRFYAGSWLLVHYLMLGNMERSRQLRTFMRMLAEGVPPKDAFPKAFLGLSETLDAELHEYLAQILARHSIPIRVLTLDSLAVDGTFSSHPIPLDQVHGRLGLLTLSLSRLSEDFANLARAHFKAAESINPACATAQFGQGIQLLQAANRSEAIPYLMKAAEGAPDDPMIQILAGKTISAHNMGYTARPDTLSPDLVLAREYLLRSQKQPPFQLDVMKLISQLYALDINRLEESVSFQEKAILAYPNEPDFPFWLGVTHLARNDREKALPLLNQVAGKFWGTPRGREAKQQLNDLEEQDLRAMVTQAVQLANSGKPSEALLMLEAAQQRAIQINSAPLQQRIQNVLMQVRNLVSESASASMKRPTTASSRKKNR